MSEFFEIEQKLKKQITQSNVEKQGSQEEDIEEDLDREVESDGEYHDLDDEESEQIESIREDEFRKSNLASEENKLQNFLNKRKGNPYLRWLISFQNSRRDWQIKKAESTSFRE